MTGASISKVPESAGCSDISGCYSISKIHQILISLKQISMFPLYYRNYGNFMCIKCQLKSKYRQANSYLLPAVSLSCQTLLQQGLLHQSQLLTPLSLVSFLHTPTHIHDFQIFTFQNAGVFSISPAATNIFSSAQMKHCTHTFFTLEVLKTKISTTKLVQEQTLLIASLKQNHLLLYTQRCCTVQRTI